jgi:hypothetical protein
VKRSEQTRKRKADDVEIATFNARDVAACTALNSVSARFIVGLFTGEIAGNFVGGNGSEMYQRGFHKLPALGIRKANKRNSSEYRMRAAGKLFEHKASLIVGTRFAENVSVENDNGVSGDNEGRTNGASGDEIGFGIGQPLHQICRILVSVGSFIDGGREHGKRDARIAKNFGAARRGGGEDNFHHEREARILLQRYGRHSCALVQ